MIVDYPFGHPCNLSVFFSVESNSSFWFGPVDLRSRSVKISPGGLASSTRLLKVSVASRRVGSVTSSVELGNSPKLVSHVMAYRLSSGILNSLSGCMLPSGLMSCWTVFGSYLRSLIRCIICVLLVRPFPQYKVRSICILETVFSILGDQR